MSPNSSASQLPSVLLTDLYQLTMAYGYWRSGLAERESVFHATFRSNPFGGGFCVAAGLEPICRFLREGFAFSQDDLAFLVTLPGSSGKPIFPPEYLAYLRDLRFQCDVDAVPEGTFVFPHEPVIRIRGPLLQAQLIETVLLNTLNFQSLIATKAARISCVAGSDTVIEFGLRRAQGVDGALAASRAAYIGGVTATSNVLAAKEYGIPLQGTHGHSWVMVFDDELEAFAEFAEALPTQAHFLVDTYDTLDGVRNAIEIGKRLREKGHDLIGIRLDSGNLAHLSKTAKAMLMEAGFHRTRIMASNDLDEYAIAKLKQEDAQIVMWGVGTRLVTAYDQPAMPGVYKLGAICDMNNQWQARVKLSEQTEKTSVPGCLAVSRFSVDGRCVADMIYDELDGGERASDMIISIENSLNIHRIPPGAKQQSLLTPIFRQGRQTYTSPSIHEVRMHVQREILRFNEGILRLNNPIEYPTGLERGLASRRAELIIATRTRAWGRTESGKKD